MGEDHFCPRWRQFGDPVLSDLMARVNVSNETVLLNLAKLRQAAGAMNTARAVAMASESLTRKLGPGPWPGVTLAP